MNPRKRHHHGGLKEQFLSAKLTHIDEVLLHDKLSYDRIISREVVYAKIYFVN